MGNKILTVEISEELYERFHRIVMDKAGPWRGSKQGAIKAIDSAVATALIEFLDSLEKSNKQVSEETGSP